MSWNYRKGPGPGPGSGARGARPFVRPADDPPGTSRLFIAVPVADDVRAAVAELMEEVAGGPIDQRAFGQPRWVRVEGLHLTLRFLGATRDDRQAEVAGAVVAAAKGVAPFEVVLSGGGAFPNAFAPRVLWLGIAEGAAELTEIARRLGEMLLPLGWPADDRPLAPHLTLARTDGVPRADERARRLEEVAGDRRMSWDADRIVLYKSIVGHGPTRYEVLATAPLEPF
jgi:2'-5' RNA ligase